MDFSQFGSGLCARDKEKLDVATFLLGGLSQTSSPHESSKDEKVRTTLPKKSRTPKQRRVEDDAQMKVMRSSPGMSVAQ